MNVGPALAFFMPVRVEVDDWGRAWASPSPTNGSGDFVALACTYDESFCTFEDLEVEAVVREGVFRTDLNQALLDGTPRGREFLLRTPMGRFGKLEELVGAAIFLASDAASFVTGHVLAVDGGFLASGVNQ